MDNLIEEIIRSLNNNPEGWEFSSVPPNGVKLHGFRLSWFLTKGDVCIEVQKSSISNFTFMNVYINGNKVNRLFRNLQNFWDAVEHCKKYHENILIKNAKKVVNIFDIKPVGIMPINNLSISEAKQKFVVDTIVGSLRNNPTSWIMPNWSPIKSLDGGQGWVNDYYWNQEDDLVIRRGVSKTSGYIAFTIVVNGKIVNLSKTEKKLIRKAIGNWEVVYHSKPESLTLKSGASIKIMKQERKPPIDSSERKPRKEINNHNARKDPGLGKVRKTHKDKPPKRFKRTRTLLGFVMFMISFGSIVLTILKWVG